MYYYIYNLLIADIIYNFRESESIIKIRKTIRKHIQIMDWTKSEFSNYKSGHGGKNSHVQHSHYQKQNIRSRQTLDRFGSPCTNRF